MWLKVHVIDLCLFIVFLYQLSLYSIQCIPWRSCKVTLYTIRRYRKGQDSCHVLSCVHMYAYHTRPVQCKNGEDHWFVFINRHAIIILQNRKSLLGRTLSISIIRSLSMSKLQYVSVLFDMFFYLKSQNR